MGGNLNNLFHDYNRGNDEGRSFLTPVGLKIQRS